MQPAHAVHTFATVEHFSYHMLAASTFAQASLHCSVGAVTVGVAGGR